MFIAKTKLERSTLIALQKQLLGTSRVNENDLVSLQYMLDNDVSLQNAQRASTIFDEMIYYTFVWTFAFNELALYQHPKIQLICHRTIDNDNCPIWCGFFTGPIGSWFSYCDENHSEKFVETVRDQLHKDGYGPRLRKNNDQSRNQIPCR